MQSYYRGHHKIENRRKASSGTANNKIVCNHAKYITDVTVSYLVGNPVRYAASVDYDIEAVKNAYLMQDITSVDFALVKNMSIYGRAYELIYADGNSDPRSFSIDPRRAFVVYDNTCENNPLFGVYYYKNYDLDGNVTGVICNVFTAYRHITYTNNTDSFANMIEESVTRHYFGAVPLIEYKNNDECQGDFEQEIPLIDAYNTLMSDRVNDKEQFVEAFLFLTGVELDDEQAKKLKEEKILMGYEGARAEYLSKVMTESDIEVLRNNLEEDIHHFSMVPNLSDDNFGNNLSGVAIKYKLLCFEQNVKNKERCVAQGLKKRFELYTNYLSLKGSMSYVPIHRVDIVFTHNLPANNLETAQMINFLKEIATDETLLGQLDFVTDAKEEAEMAKNERAERETENARRIAAEYTAPKRNEN